MVARHLSVSATSWSGDESLFGVDVLAARARVRAPTAVWTPRVGDANAMLRSSRGLVCQSRVHVHVQRGARLGQSTPRDRNLGQASDSSSFFPTVHGRRHTARHPGVNGCGTAARAVVVLGARGFW